MLVYFPYLDVIRRCTMLYEMPEGDCVENHSEESFMYSRGFRAKLSIAEALNTLCSQRPFNSIKISDLVKAAGISRSSFYYHFYDLEDVAVWVSHLFSSQGIDQIGRKFTWYEGHLATTEYFLEYRHLLSSAEAREGLDGAVPAFIRHRKETMKQTIVEYQGKELTEEILFQIEALPYSESHMFSEFNGGLYKDMPIETFCHLMVEMVPRALFEAMETVPDRSPHRIGFHKL